MNRAFLIDTDAVIARLGGDPAILQLLASAEEIFIPGIVLGELYYGAERSARVAANLAQIDAFASGRSILSCDADTARWYGRVKYHLQVKGRPIPQNDTWIAALAFQYQLTLVTRDMHFQQVDGLKVELW